MFSSIHWVHRVYGCFVIIYSCTFGDTFLIKQICVRNVGTIARKKYVTNRRTIGTHERLRVVGWLAVLRMFISWNLGLMPIKRLNGLYLVPLRGGFYKEITASTMYGRHFLCIALWPCITDQSYLRPPIIINSIKFDTLVRMISR